MSIQYSDRAQTVRNPEGCVILSDCEKTRFACELCGKNYVNSMSLCSHIFLGCNTAASHSKAVDSAECLIGDLGEVQRWQEARVSNYEEKNEGDDKFQSVQAASSLSTATGEDKLEELLMELRLQHELQQQLLRQRFLQCSRKGQIRQYEAFSSHTEVWDEEEGQHVEAAGVGVLELNEDRSAREYEEGESQICSHVRNDTANQIQDRFLDVHRIRLSSAPAHRTPPSAHTS